MEVCDNYNGAADYTAKRKSTDFLSMQNDVLLAADLLAGVGTGYLSVILYRMFMNGAVPALDLDAALWRETLLGSVIAALVLREPRLAEGRQFRRPRAMYPVLCQRGGAALAILLAVGLATRALNDMARLWVLLWAASFAVWVAVSRLSLVMYASRLAARGGLREAVAVVGTPGLADRLAARLAQEAEVVAVYDHVDGMDDAALGVTLDDILDLASAGLIDTIVVAMASGGAGAGGLVQQLKSVPVQVTLCHEPPLEAPASLSFRVLGGVPLTVVADRPLKRWDLLFKALMDRVGALLLLAVFAPLMLAASVAILAESPGPAIFRQQRRGWSGRVFTIYKFRTMRHETTEFPLRQTERNDPRCTRVGAVLRHTSFDELPQLWNVLRGDMSLVGPRPHPEAMHALHEAGCQIVAEYAQRQLVKPGITGWAQINGSRGPVRTPEQMRQRVHYDLHYIDHWSVWLDLYILACTPLCLLGRENAF
jgi:exopolysaccharide biosynthesis polyprenyl glycosylphosphotransferase